jgi:membrane protein DedA with SNARE-associated domain
MSFPHDTLISILLTYKYLVVFPAVFFEGPVTTIIVGFLTSLHYFNFIIAYVIIVLADLASDVMYYFLGRFGHEHLIARFGRYVGITKERMEKLRTHFEGHGGKMLVIGKIADPLSSTMQALAGAARMPFGWYILVNIFATLPKSLILLSAGYYFGEAFNQVDAYRKIVGIWGSVIAAIVLFGYLIVRKKESAHLLADAASHGSKHGSLTKTD